MFLHGHMTSHVTLWSISETQHVSIESSRNILMDVSTLFCFFSRKEALPQRPLPLFLLLRGLETIWRCHAFLTSLALPWKCSGRDEDGAEEGRAQSERKGRSRNLIVQEKMDGSSLLFRQNVKERPRDKRAAASGLSGESDKEKTSGRKMKPFMQKFLSRFYFNFQIQKIYRNFNIFYNLKKKNLIKSAVALNKCSASMWCWCTVSFFHSSSSRKVKTEDWNVCNITS